MQDDQIEGVRPPLGVPVVLVFDQKLHQHVPLVAGRPGLDEQRRRVAFEKGVIWRDVRMAAEG